jgi:hypothetical protein
MQRRDGAESMTRSGLDQLASDALDDTAPTTSEIESGAGQYMPDDDRCQCSVCNRTLWNVAEFDRHRSCGRCRTGDKSLIAVPDVSKRASRLIVRKVPVVRAT